MLRTLRTSSWLAGPCVALLAAACACAQGVAAPTAAPAAAPGAVPAPPQLATLPPLPAAATPAPATAAPAAAAASAPGAPNRRVIEDDNVRMEETRVRGQLQRVTVHNKRTGKDYEVIVGPGGRDPSQKRDAAGQPAWLLFSF